VGSVIKGVGLGIRSRSHPWDQGSQTVGIGISSFLGIRDKAVPFFVGSGTKICHAVGIKDQKFGYKNGISDEKIYLVTTLN